MTKERRDRTADRIDKILRAGSPHVRYHQAQADPSIDTAAKRLARRAGLDQVQCPCGDVFPSAVQEK